MVARTEQHKTKAFCKALHVLESPIKLCPLQKPHTRPYILARLSNAEQNDHHSSLCPESRAKIVSAYVCEKFWSLGKRIIDGMISTGQSGIGSIHEHRVCPARILPCGLGGSGRHRYCSIVGYSCFNQLFTNSDFQKHSPTE